MKHPTTEELLLLTEAEEARGEANADTAAHLEACPACRATLGELLGMLTAATSEIRATVADPSAHEDAAAWARLESALIPEEAAPYHLETHELLLSVDGDLDPARSAHLEACGVCSAELLRTHHLLAEIELELRDMVEDEPPARRAAALAALEARLDVAPASAQVVEFPAAKRRAPVWQTYAAAAALAGLTLGGLYYAQTGSVQPTTVATVIEAPGEPVEATSAAPVASQPVVDPILVTPATVDEAVPAVPDVFAMPTAPRQTPYAAGALDAAPIEIATAFESAAWTPSWQAPRVPAPSAPAPSMAAEAEALHTSAPAPTVSVGDRVVGGVVRTALLGHYRDAARRSFQAPEPTALEGELARFVTDVYRSQSELLRHAYELNRLVAERDSETDHTQLRKSATANLRQVAAHERAIYDGLAETLPRKFWAPNTGEEAPAAESADLEAKLLLDDALRLEETLTTLFNRPASTVDASLDRTPGELLDRIETRIRRLRGSLDTL